MSSNNNSRENHTTHEELEEGSRLQLDFSKLRKVAQTGQDLLPAACQNVSTGEVLIIGYVNRQALEYSLKEKVVAFWSTSRNELWIKGATSGDYLDIKDIRVNCEQNSLLFLVELRGKGACHTTDAQGIARRGCYYRGINSEGNLSFVNTIDT